MCKKLLSVKLLMCLFVCICLQQTILCIGVRTRDHQGTAAQVQAQVPDRLHSRRLKLKEKLPDRAKELELVEDISTKTHAIAKNDSEADDDGQAESLPPPAPRTATGGIINSLMIFLSFLAFLGNAVFLIHVFWLKEKIDHTLAPPKSILPFNNFGMGAE